MSPLSAPWLNRSSSVTERTSDNQRHDLLATQFMLQSSSE